MRQIIVTFAVVFLSVGFSLAQQNDYKKRNHKLNKHYQKDLQDEKHEFKSIRQDIDLNVNEYLARNAKFHKHSSEFMLVATKDHISYNYRELNHKLNRNFKQRMYNFSPSDTTVTKN